MYAKRAYIVPELNEGDGILLYIPKNTEGVYESHDTARPLFSDEVELYEVTKIADWRDYAEFTASKVSHNTTSADIITGTYVDDGLMLQEPENLRFCSAAHIGARVQSEEPGYDDRFLYAPYSERDMKVVEISHIYADGVSYIPEVNAFSFTNKELKLLKSFYEDDFDGYLNRPGGDTASNVSRVLDILNLESREYENFLPREAFEILVQLCESAEHKESRDILERQLWDDSERVGYYAIEEYRTKDMRFLMDISPYDYSGDDFERWRDDYELLDITFEYLQNRRGDLERINIDKLTHEEKLAVFGAQALATKLSTKLLAKLTDELADSSNHDAEDG